MSSVTREFGHFLVKFEVDDSYYVCPRIKVLTDGRVRIGETYNVVWGKSDDDSDLAEILDSGDWLDMRKKMSELEQDSSSPTSPLHQTKRKMPASNSNSLSKKQKAEANLLCIQERTTVSDPYQFFPESPESPVLPFHLTATSPVQPPPLTQTREMQTLSDLPAFLLNNTLSDILKQINVISTRQGRCKLTICWLNNNRALIISLLQFYDRQLRHQPIFCHHTLYLLRSSGDKN